MHSSAGVRIRRYSERSCAGNPSTVPDGGTVRLRFFASVILLFLLAVLSICLPGCAGRHCPGVPASGQSFGTARNVSAVIVSEKGDSRDAITEDVARASDIFFEQTGIRLVIADWKEIEWYASTRDGLLQELASEMRGYQKPYDVAIGFYDMDPLQWILFNTLGGWMGVIDDEYRKFIVVRRDQPFILVHELGHAFIFQHVHSGGAMTAYTVCVVGDHLCLNKSLCFLDSDQREIISNRNRDFSTKPVLLEKQDLIDGDIYTKTYLRVLYEFVSKPFRERPSAPKKVP